MNVVQLVGVRNGLLRAYTDLKIGFELLKRENETLKHSAGSYLSAALDAAAENNNAALIKGLKAEENDYTGAVLAQMGFIRNNMGQFGRDLDKTAVDIKKLITSYVDKVSSMAQVACQTERQRKCYDMGIQVVD